MATTTYTVKKGDTLWNLVEEYKDSIAGSTREERIQTVVKLNNLKDRDLIVIGQVLKFSGTATKETSTGSQAVVDVFGLQSNTERTLYAKWSCTIGHVEDYTVEWMYDTGDGIWFEGNVSTDEFEYKHSLYTPPDNAKRVKFRVKANSQIRHAKRKGQKHDIYWFTAKWSTAKTFSFVDLPVAPGTPSAKIETLKLTAEVNCPDVNATHIQFQVVKDDKTVFATGKAKISTDYASYVFPISVGARYKVRCRSINGNNYSDWSDYCGNVGTAPSAPTGFTVCRAESEYSVYFEWDTVNLATSYEIEYATNLLYFEGSNQTQSQSGIEGTKYLLTISSDKGEEYFFRLRAVNSEGSSAWSEISSVVLGEEPAPPTTWSSTTTAVPGEDCILYWVHNSIDGSSMKYAEIELLFDDGTSYTWFFDHTEVATDSEDIFEYKLFDGDQYPHDNIQDGGKILWRVRTVGVLASEDINSGNREGWSEWSVQRTIVIYSAPTLQFNILNLRNENIWEGEGVIDSFPFYISLAAAPTNQRPTGYHVSVVSNQIYETVDDLGNTQTINNGQEVFSKYYDISGEIIDGAYHILIEMSAGDINLENNMSYTVTCTVSMNSGLTATSSLEFTVAWTDEQHILNAELAIDEETLSAYISPYCHEYTTVRTYYNVREVAGIYVKLNTELSQEEIDGVENTVGYNVVENTYTSTYEEVCYTVLNGVSMYFCIVENEELFPSENVTLGVYRRSYDGSYVEIASDLVNGQNTFVTDPHPALDYARYRIVAKSTLTGTVGYYDIPGQYVGCNAAVIQWNEDWSTLDMDGENLTEQPAWSGSMLRLPYNLDINEDYNPDVSLVEYIGRERPVSYYGTQLGETSSWSLVIPKEDRETLYHLRRLAKWRGDVYVRTPTGIGYWANIKVAFGEKHLDVTIPVTISITRVEGGI